MPYPIHGGHMPLTRDSGRRSDYSWGRFCIKAILIFGLAAILWQLHPVP